MIQIVVSNSSQQPLYLQIVQQLKSSIMLGEIEPGEALPSIRTLAADLSISVITTKRAYDELESQGLIETVPGKGCFAAGDNQLLRERRLTLLEESIRQVLNQAEYLGISQKELMKMITIVKENDDE